MKFNSDITQAPKNVGLLLQYDLMPYPLTGVLRDDFEGGIALVLPYFEVRPDDNADKDDLLLFECNPDDWFYETTGNQLELANLYININPAEYSLVIPPKSWRLVGWAEVWENEKVTA